MGEDGRFWVNAENLRLMRLKVTAFKIPPQLQLRSLSVALEYHFLNNALAPARASLDALETNGNAFHNAAAFSSCHTFGAESKIVDSESATAAVLNQYKSQQPLIPPGVTLRLRLNEPLLARDAMVGQLVTATLESAVKISPSLSLRQGSLCRGRVRRFERLDYPPNTYIVGFSFAELDADGKIYRLAAELKSMQRLEGIRAEISRTRSGPLGIGISPGRKLGSTPGPDNDYQAAPVMPGAAVFFLTDSDSVPKGLPMIWRTTKIKI